MFIYVAYIEALSITALKHYCLLCYSKEDNTTSTSELLQMTTERVGILFSTTLNTSGNESVQASLVRTNIGKLTCECEY